MIKFNALWLMLGIVHAAEISALTNDDLFSYKMTGIKFESEDRNKGFKYLLCGHALTYEGQEQRGQVYFDAAISIYRKLDDDPKIYFLDYGRTEYLVPLNNLEIKAQVKEYEETRDVSSENQLNTLTRILSC